MTSFTENLQATLEGVNARFQEAEHDLHEVVAEASLGIQAVTQGTEKVVLIKLREGTDAVNYTVRLETDGQQKADLLSYTLSRRGYPMNVPFIGVIQNKQELKKVFDEMATNPDSSLIVNLAFFMRQTQKPPA
jgi:hypothetical protein